MWPSFRYTDHLLQMSQEVLELESFDHLLQFAAVQSDSFRQVADQVNKRLRDLETKL